MSTNETKMYDVIVVGSGPAGYSAALYACRANLQTVCFVGPQPGGQLTTTNEVENYLGLLDVTGFEMTELFRKHAERYGLQTLYSEVIEINETEEPPVTECGVPQKRFRVLTSDEETFYSKSIIIATGASAKRLNLPNEEKFWNNGISACAVCDGSQQMFRNQVICCVGGGDTACEEALHMTRFASQVFLIHRGPKLRASGIMQKRVFEHPLIQVILNTQVVDVFGDEKLRGVHVIATNSDQKESQEKQPQQIPASGLFYGIGHTPNTAFLKNSNLLIQVDDQGYIVTEKGSTRTSHAGVFACGDVQDKIYRQAITSAGSGCMAALDACHFLQHQLNV